jgi:hypothetical protein
VRLRADGRVLVELKTARRDGTSHLIFDPIEFMEKLAAITPRPAVNLVIYHGVLAPRARWRAAVVRDGRPEPDAPVPTADTRPRGAWTWAVLMHRVFPRCPRLSPLWWPAAGHRHRGRPGRRAGPPGPRRSRAPPGGAGPGPTRPGRPQVARRSATSASECFDSLRALRNRLGRAPRAGPGWRAHSRRS